MTHPAILCAEHTGFGPLTRYERERAETDRMDRIQRCFQAILRDPCSYSEDLAVLQDSGDDLAFEMAAWEAAKERANRL